MSKNRGSKAVENSSCGTNRELNRSPRHFQTLDKYPFNNELPSASIHLSTELATAVKIPYHLPTVLRLPKTTALKTADENFAKNPVMPNSASEQISVPDPNFIRSDDLQTDSLPAMEDINSSIKGPSDSNVSVTNRDKSLHVDREKYRKLVYDYETACVDRDSYAEQLKIQSQVNGELKKLLVATMGDDLEIKMECLTSDKVNLARDIVKYSAELCDEKEQLERANIQSDVWRSKFLACSIMVDESISWRYFLIRQFQEAQRSMSALLTEVEQLRKTLYSAFLRLNEINEVLHVKEVGKYKHISQRHDILELVECLSSLCQALHSKLLNKVAFNPGTQHCNLTEPLVGCTESQKSALRICSINSDEFHSLSPCDEFQKLTDRHAKLMGYPAHCNFRNLTVNCCRKCAGEIKVV